MTNNVIQFMAQPRVSVQKQPQMKPQPHFDANGPRSMIPHHVINNEPKLLQGFIFVSCPDEHAAMLPPAYLVERLGSFGYYGKLDQDNVNGFNFIPWSDYHD